MAVMRPVMSSVMRPVMNGVMTFGDSGVAPIPEVAAEYWNPADKGADIVISNSDKTADDPSETYQSVRSVTSHGSGKWYAEMVNSGAAGGMMGLANGTFSTDSFVGVDADGVGYFGDDGSMLENGGGSSYGGSITSSDVIGFAVDVPNKLLYISINNTWQNSADPAAGTGGYSYGVTGDVYLACSPIREFVLRTADADFSYTPPTGFQAWG